MNTQANSEDQKLERLAVKASCMFCQNNKHQLHKCAKFTVIDLEERRKYVQGKKLYGCLHPGYRAKDCCYCHTCNSCKGRHPTCLHDDNYVKQAKTTHPLDQPQSVPASTAAMALNVVTGQPTCTSMIMPVWVSIKNNPKNEKLVYTVLDTQSNATFIDQAVSGALQADTRPVKLRLTTMIDKNTVLKSNRVTGFQVKSYQSL